MISNTSPVSALTNSDISSVLGNAGDCHMGMARSLMFAIGELRYLQVCHIYCILSHTLNYGHTQLV